MADEIENQEVIDNQEKETQDVVVPEIKFTVVSNDDAQQNSTPQVSIKDDDTDYVELNDDLAYQHLADQRGVSVEEFKQSLEAKNNDEYVELDEDYAVQFIAEKKGMSVEDFKNSLTPKQQKQYAPEIEGFQDFYEKTGNKNFNDYLETQKDWTAETPESILREYIKLSNPDLTAKESDYLYKKKYSIEDLDEEDDSDEIFEKGIDTKADLRKANEFFAKRKEEFKGVGGSDEYIPIEYREAKKLIDNQKEQEANYNTLLDEVRLDNVNKANQTFNDKYEGFVYDIVNEDKSVDRIVYKPENLEVAKSWAGNLNNLNERFFDETGRIKPETAKEFHAITEIARIGVQKYTEQIARTAQANLIEKQDRISKNIQPDNIKPQFQQATAGITYTVEK